jgi:hypothetical protein
MKTEKSRKGSKKDKGWQVKGRLLTTALQGGVPMGEKRALQCGWDCKSASTGVKFP